jgi:hypothetical protein
MQEKSRMNNFLLDCSLKSYSTCPKFDQFNQTYAIFSALCGIVLDHAPLLFSIALDHGPTLCHIARDHTYAHINSIAQDPTYLFVSLRIYNDIQKYFSAWIRDLDGIV